MSTNEMTIADISYQDLASAYTWLIKTTNGTMLDEGHPAMPLALAIEAEIVKRHSASVDFINTQKAQEAK
jgi:hypothetical protein